MNSVKNVNSGYYLYSIMYKLNVCVCLNINLLVLLVFLNI